MTQSSNSKLQQVQAQKPADAGQDASDAEAKPALSEDSQAFIGLKLRELYDDVVAEPVPDRFLELLGKLGHDTAKQDK